MKPINYGKCRKHSFLFTRIQKDSYALRSMESNCLKGSGIQTVHSIEFKFDMYIIDHRFTFRINFSEFRINSFLQEYKKIFFYIAAYGVKL